VRALLALLLLAGCDRVFGIDEIGKPADAQLPDSPDASSACALTDNFDDNMLDAAIWQVSDLASPVHVIEQGQQLEVQLPMDAPNYVSNSIYTRQSIDLRNSTVEVTVYPMSEVGFSEMFLELNDANGNMAFDTGAGNFNIRDTHTGFSQNFVWDPVAYKHWRFRYDAATQVLFFEVSPDGGAWSALVSGQQAGYDVSAETIIIGAGAFQGTFDRGTAAFDDLAYCHAP
jgi:hypothetical protein